MERYGNIVENFHNVRITSDPKKAMYYSSNNIPFVVCLNEENKGMTFPNGAYCFENPHDIDDDCLERVYRRFMGIPWDILETDRLSVREIAVSDVPRLYELYKASSITEYMEPLYENIEQEIEYTKDYINKVYRFYGYGMWVILERESRLVIGRVGLENKEGFDGLELGFMLGVEYQHKGYAYEACKAVLDYAKEELGQTKICAYVDENNVQSIRLCVKLGFVDSGKENNRKIFCKFL